MKKKDNETKRALNHALSARPWQLSSTKNEESYSALCSSAESRVIMRLSTLQGSCRSLAGSLDSWKLFCFHSQGFWTFQSIYDWDHFGDLVAAIRSLFLTVNMVIVIWLTMVVPYKPQGEASHRENASLATFSQVPTIFSQLWTGQNSLRVEPFLHSILNLALLFL